MRVIAGLGHRRRAGVGDIASLAAGIPYYFRIVATNAGGTSYGAEQALTTLLPTTLQTLQPQGPSGQDFNARSGSPALSRTQGRSGTGRQARKHDSPRKLLGHRQHHSAVSEHREQLRRHCDAARPNRGRR